MVEGSDRLVQLPADLFFIRKCVIELRSEGYSISEFYVLETEMGIILKQKYSSDHVLNVCRR